MILSDTLSLTLLGVIATAICVAFLLQDLSDAKTSSKMFLFAFMSIFLALVLDLLVTYIPGSGGSLIVVREIFAATYGLALLIAVSWRYRPEGNIYWFYPLAIGYLLAEFFVENNLGQTLYYWAIVHAFCGLIVLARPDGRNMSDNLLVLAFVLLALIKVDIVTTIMTEQDMSRFYSGINFIADNHAILLPGAFSAVVVFLATSYLQDATEKLQFLSNKDLKTGLISQTALYEQAELVIAMSNRIGKKSSVLVSVISDIKTIEANFGEENLDRAISAFAQMLENQLRAEDLIARWSEDEIVIVLPKTDLQQAKVLCNRIQEKIKLLRVNTNRGDITLEASLSIASIDNKNGLDQAISNATAKNDDVNFV